MTTLTILALGSRGDVQPYAALGVGLARAGYRVRIATFSAFRTLVEDNGLLFHDVPGDPKALVGNTGGNGNFRQQLDLMRRFGSIVGDYIQAFSDPVLNDSAAILNQLPGGLFGRDLAEKLGVPYIALSVIPLVPTAAWASPLLTARNMGALNRVSYAFSAQVLWAAFRSHIATYRRKIGLATAPPLFLKIKDPLTLNGFSPLVVPPPPDWDETVHTVGYWQLAEPDFAPSPDLIAFLQEDESPVFIGFGSMSAPDPAALTKIVVEAVQQTGVRAVLSGGWGNLGGIDLPPPIRRIDYVPYGWLFPRVRAIVHHGGSGTTGLALHSGTPNAVVSFLADQPYWGKRLAALGVGVSPLAVQRLTSTALSDVLRHLVSDTAMQQRAARLGDKLRQEDGIKAAVDIIRQQVPL